MTEAAPCWPVYLITDCPSVTWSRWRSCPGCTDGEQAIAMQHYRWAVTVQRPALQGPGDVLRKQTPRERPWSPWRACVCTSPGSWQDGELRRRGCMWPVPLGVLSPPTPPPGVCPLAFKNKGKNAEQMPRTVEYTHTISLRWSQEGKAKQLLKGAHFRGQPINKAREWLAYR